MWRFYSLVYSHRPRVDEGANANFLQECEGVKLTHKLVHATPAFNHISTPKQDRHCLDIQRHFAKLLTDIETQIIPLPVISRLLLSP
jgi:hypothetical protein